MKRMKVIPTKRINHLRWWPELGVCLLVGGLVLLGLRFPDFTRFAILVGWAGLIGYVGVIVVSYAQISRTAPTRTARLLPEHVTFIGLSYIMAVSTSAYESYVRLGEPWSAYLAVNATIVATGLVAFDRLWRRLAYLRHDYHVHHPDPLAREVDERLS